VVVHGALGLVSSQREAREGQSEQKQLNSHMDKNEPQLYLTWYIKTQKKSIINLNARPKIIKQLEKNHFLS
jgi:hypothetical protein